MLAYHNDAAIKQFYIDRLTAHYNADEMIKGKYWQNGKGCAVGCIIHGSDHSIFPKKLGIPIWFARMAIDQVFERLPNDLSKDWPLRVMQAIPVGFDLDSLFNPLLLWFVKRAKSYVTVDNWGVIPAIDAVINAIETGVGLAGAGDEVEAAFAVYAAYVAAMPTDVDDAAYVAMAAKAVSLAAAWAKMAKMAEREARREDYAAYAAKAARTAAVWVAEAEDAAQSVLFWTDFSDEIIRLLGDTHVSIS